eukprot:gene3578-biopygen13412
MPSPAAARQALRVPVWAASPGSETRSCNLTTVSRREVRPAFQRSAGGGDGSPLPPAPPRSPAHPRAPRARPLAVRRREGDGGVDAERPPARRVHRAHRPARAPDAELPCVHRHVDAERHPRLQRAGAEYERRQRVAARAVLRVQEVYRARPRGPHPRRAALN